MPPKIAALITELQRIHALEEAAGLLSWDEQVNLPPASAQARGAQMAALSNVIHEQASSRRLGDLLEAAEDECASGEATTDVLSLSQIACILEHARKDYDRAVKIPAEFIARKAAARSRGYHGWTAARATDDFNRFRPFLEEQLDLALEEAAYLGHDIQSAYDYMLDQYDTGITQAFIDPLFAELQTELPGIAAEARQLSTKNGSLPLLKGFPVDRQAAFLRQVVESLGFDFSRGRIDVAVHPFCSGNAHDCRLTTRFHEDVPLDSLFSAIHECGHGLYEQGLPAAYLGTALGKASGMATHESQSRLWENQVGRSREFWQHWESRYREAFAKQLVNLDSDRLYQAITAVRREPIRVDSDEVHYNLHIILRYELEKRLFRKDLAASDLPEAWNELSETLLGLRPENDATGCLQDVHWSEGYFGYFPSYALGNLLAAQIWENLCKSELPKLPQLIAAGQTMPLLNWLREHIHQIGMMETLPVLCQRATGQPLQARYLLQYLRERYTANSVGKTN